MRKLYQTERSAQSHPRIEARRLVGAPPARPLLATARHADAVMQELPERASHHALPISPTAVAIGSTLSALRSSLLDLLMDNETSYRGTLLGLRHGLDIILMLREAASAAGDEELAEWADRIAKARQPLVDECAEQLAWFGQNPEQAITLVAEQALRSGLQALRSSLSKPRPDQEPNPDRDQNTQEPASA